MLQIASVVNVRLELKFRNIDPLSKIHRSTEQTTTGSPYMFGGRDERKRRRALKQEQIFYCVLNLSSNKQQNL